MAEKVRENSNSKTLILKDRRERERDRDREQQLYVQKLAKLLMSRQVK